MNSNIKIVIKECPTLNTGQWQKLQQETNKFISCLEDILPGSELRGVVSGLVVGETIKKEENMILSQIDPQGEED